MAKASAKPISWTLENLDFFRDEDLADDAFLVAFDFDLAVVDLEAALEAGLFLIGFFVAAMTLNLSYF